MPRICEQAFLAWLPGARLVIKDVKGEEMKAATMKDCLGEILVPGDRVVIVAPSAPMKQGFLHMGAEVVKRRGRKVVVRFPDSDYVKYNKCVLPDSIMKESSWHRERGYKPIVTDGSVVCQACRNPGAGLVCLCK